MAGWPGLVPVSGIASRPPSGCPFSGRFAPVVEPRFSSNPVSQIAKAIWLPGLDSNQNWVSQSHLCYHYTTRQWRETVYVAPNENAVKAGKTSDGGCTGAWLAPPSPRVFYLEARPPGSGGALSPDGTGIPAREFDHFPVQDDRGPEPCAGKRGLRRLKGSIGLLPVCPLPVFLLFFPA